MDRFELVPGIAVTNVEKTKVSDKLSRLDVTFNDGLHVHYRLINEATDKPMVFGPANVYPKTDKTTKQPLKDANGKVIMNNWPEVFFDSKTADRKLRDFLLTQ